MAKTCIVLGHERVRELLADGRLPARFADLRRVLGRKPPIGNTGPERLPLAVTAWTVGC